MLGKYIRLSDQDDDCRPGEKAESNSVANQRLLLNHFIASHSDLASQYALEFVDDGHTGFNFNRPGVQALFSAVKRGEIDCILVKDLSRFGRNSIEVGEYLERVFPLLNVRFIAVNDGLDTKTRPYGVAGDLDVGARSIINELYSRNVSTNVRTAKRQYAARGECIAAYPFYGYVKGAEDRRRLEIDPPSADTVRMIFRLWLEGNSAETIANTLNAQSIPSPSMRKRELGVKRTSWSKRRDEIPWTIHAIRVILQNERYTGKLISLRSTRKEIGNPNQRAIPKENWIVVPDAFEAIISEDVFQKAQTLFRAVPSRVQHKTGCSHPLFSRKVFCGVCGMGLSYRRMARPYYRCKAPKGGREECKSVRISEDDLNVRVLTELHSHSALCAGKPNPETNADDTDTLRDQLAALEQKMEKQWSAKKDAFVKWNDGLISKRRYQIISDERQREIQRLRLEIDRLSSILASDHATETAVSIQAAKAAEATELSREMIDVLIQGVRVFDDGQIEIEWKAR